MVEALTKAAAGPFTQLDNRELWGLRRRKMKMKMTLSMSIYMMQAFEIFLSILRPLWSLMPSRRPKKVGLFGKTGRLLLKYLQ